MVEGLWGPLTHVFVAREWDLAMCGGPFSATRRAQRVAVAAAFRSGRSVVVITLLLIGGCVGTTDSCPYEIRGGRPSAHPWSPRICRHRAGHGRAACRM